ncbi:uncharacterized protein LOC133527267 [Cydia pomonella]|uniref:uncharacterized protein LOC133527267 n=1 Tax=Cydia pomonella TaxID=82600 RepID=UPI002ADE64D8|nr:uncharacterized protein LOC133527267 [Cydia pomonella]
MVSHKVQLLASLLFISEVYTQFSGRYGYGNEQNGRSQPSPNPGQFIIPAIIKPLPSRSPSASSRPPLSAPYSPPSAPSRPLSAPSQPPNTLTNDVIIDRLVRLLICDMIETDNVGVDVDVKEGKNVDVQEKGKKNDVTSENKEPEICVFIRPFKG